jgi:plasmid stability protein
MCNITIHHLEPDLTQRLEQRAAQHGRTIEAEIKAILQSVLAPKTNLVEAIEKHFAHLGDFDIPEITREPMGTAPNFESIEA